MNDPNIRPQAAGTLYWWSKGVTLTPVPFEFTGKAREYFRIWIVNVALTICTLGIYSAWAKVRKKRYLYGNTLLQGTSFEYHGDPIKILKGRLIIGGMLLAYYVGGVYNPAVDEARPDNEPRAPAIPVGLMAGIGIVVGAIGLAVGVFAMVFGATAYFCPLAFLIGIVSFQILMARGLGLPVRGPSEPMGAPPEEE